MKREAYATARIALDPTPTQERKLRSHCGAARFAYNVMLSVVITNRDQRGAERTYEIAEESLTPAMSWSPWTLMNEWNARKREVAPWWKEVSKEAFASGCRDLAAALKNWKDSKAGTRAGAKMGFPIYKKRFRRMSTTYTTGPMRLDDAHHVTLPKLGKIHLHENSRKLYQRLQREVVEIKRATISYRRGRWWVSLLLKHRTDPPAGHRNPGTCVGIDVGAKDLLVAATPNGTEVLRVPFPAELHKLEARKRALQRRNRHRQQPSTGVAPSKRWLRAKNRIAKLDYRIANLRENLLNQATTTLTREYETVVVETLHVIGMKAKGGAHKRGVNRAVALAAMASTRQLVTYKCVREGGQLVLADRFYPSSKTCSSCGTVKAKLSLNERTFVCACGLRLDRDLNAAINLARLGTAGSGPVAGCGAERKTGAPSSAEAAGDEASIPQRASASDGDSLLVTAGPGTRAS